MMFFRNFQQLYENVEYMKFLESSLMATDTKNQ